MKSKKNYFLLTVFFILITLINTSAQNSGEALLRGSKIRYVTYSNIKYVSLGDLSLSFGLQVSGSKGIINLEGGGKSVKLMPGKRVAIVNSSFIKFRGPVRNIGGQLYVPEDFLQAVYNSSLKTASSSSQPVKPVEPVQTDMSEITKDTPAVEQPPLVIPENTEMDTVTGIQVDKGEENTNMILEFNREIEKRIKLKKNIDSTILTITIPETASTISNNIIPVDNGYITDIKYIQAGKDKIVIKITGKKKLLLKAYSTGNNQIKINIRPEETDEAPLDLENLNDEVAAGTDSALLVSSSELTPEILKKGLDGIKKVICIDPGHGGSDFGVTIEGKTKEKHIVMEVANRVNKLLEIAGQKSYLTRSGDYFINYDQRISLINEKKPELLVSIHCNANLDINSDSARGTEIYYFDSPLTVSENSSFSTEKLNDSQIKNEVHEILQGKNRESIKENSIKLGESIQKNITKYATNSFSRGIKSENILLLKEAQMPAVHIELGFLTNPVDVKLLEDPDYREKLALGIFQGIKEYLINKNEGR